MSVTSSLIGNSIVSSKLTESVRNNDTVNINMIKARVTYMYLNNNQRQKYSETQFVEILFHIQTCLQIFVFENIVC